MIFDFSLIFVFVIIVSSNQGSNVCMVTCIRTSQVKYYGHIRYSNYIKIDLDNSLFSIEPFYGGLSGIWIYEEKFLYNYLGENIYFGIIVLFKAKNR